MPCNQLLEHGELVIHTLVHFGNRQLLRAAHHDFCRLLRNDRGQNPGLLQEFDPHPVMRIELFPLVAGLGIVHAGVGQDPIDIRRK